MSLPENFGTFPSLFLTWRIPLPSHRFSFFLQSLSLTTRFRGKRSQNSAGLWATKPNFTFTPLTEN